MVDRFNPFTPNFNGTPLSQCQKKYDLKKVFTFLPLDNLNCKPIHAEFAKVPKQLLGVKTMWLFECYYKAPVLMTNNIMYVRIEADMSSHEIAAGNYDEIKSDEGVNWLVGSNKSFLQNGLYDKNSLRCE